MATIGLFCGVDYIKSNTFIDENVDEKLIKLTIADTQEERTKSVLGTALYNEVKGQIEAGTLTSLNTTLRDTYIKPALKYWVLYDMIDETWIKATNKSLVNKKSENSDPVSPDTVLFIKNKYMNRAERYDEKLRLYLVENSTSYPLYLQPGTGADTIHPKWLTYGTGWYLGDNTAPDGFDVDTGNQCY